MYVTMPLGRFHISLAPFLLPVGPAPDDKMAKSRGGFGQGLHIIKLKKAFFLKHNEVSFFA